MREATKAMKPTFAVRAALSLIALLGGFMAPASAQEEAGCADQPVVLTIPFDPPLGTPLGYTVLIEKKRSKGDSAMELEQELTFEPLGDGYLLKLDILAATIEGTRLLLTDREVLNQMPAAARPFLTSVEIELDPAGEPLRLRNWEAMRELLQGLPEMTLDRIDPDQRQGAVEALEMIFSPLLSSTAEEAPYAIVKGWPSILGYGGMELDDGELYGIDSEVDSGLFPAPLPAVVELSLSRTEGGDYRYVQTTQPDPQALLEAATALVREIEAMKGSNGKPVHDGTLSADDIAMSDRLDVVFEQETGMPLSAVITRKINANASEAASRGDIITITRRAR